MKYVCAVKRGARDDPETPGDWPERLAAMPGVAVQGQPLFGRVTIEADAAAAEAVRERFGHFLHVEPLVRYRPAGDDGP